MGKRILLVFGTRPEAIKMAPLYHELVGDDSFEVGICVTAQHREMLDQVLNFFELEPNYDLNLMRPGQSLNDIFAAVLTGMKPVLADFRPDIVLVHGDTATSSAAALAAYFSAFRVGHVEAGLRTYNKWAPFPEEINRQITGRIADVHFAPTERSKENLLSERIDEKNIIITGNTVIDALQQSVEKVNTPSYKNNEIIRLEEVLDPKKEIILVTGHRRENFGKGFTEIAEALLEIAKSKPNIQIVYPVHLNPKVQEPIRKVLGGISNIHLTDPLGYPAFVWLMDKSKLIITDSGGVQEEAPSLGKPVLVMRDTTERPEAVEAGTVILIGTNREKIVTEALDLLSNAKRYEQMSRLSNPYGDGKASKRIAEFLHEYL